MKENKKLHIFLKNKKGRFCIVLAFAVVLFLFFSLFNRGALKNGNKKSKELMEMEKILKESRIDTQRLESQINEMRIKLEREKRMKNIKKNSESESPKNQPKKQAKTFGSEFYYEYDDIVEKNGIYISGVKGDFIYDAFKRNGGFDGSVQIRNIMEEYKQMYHDAVLLDIGANIGTMSFPVAVEGTGVIAIEAHPENQKRLGQAIMLNRVHKNMLLIPYGVGDHEDVLYISSFCKTCSNHFIATDQKMLDHWNDLSKTVSNIDAVSNVFEVQILRLKTIFEKVLANKQVDFIKNLSQIKFIKIDIEGFEPIVINDNLDFLRKNMPGVYIECNPDFLSLRGFTCSGIAQTMQDLGYNVYDTGRLIDASDIGPKTFMDVLFLSDKDKHLAKHFKR